MPEEYTELEDFQSDDPDNIDIEFQPMLYVRKTDLPANTSAFAIINQLEHIYGHKGQFHHFESTAYFSIMFPKKLIAVKARKDGLNFENVNVTLYDFPNHATWLQHQYNA